MTDKPNVSAAVKTGPKKAAPPPGKNLKKSAEPTKKAVKVNRKLFAEDTVNIDVIENEEVELSHHQRQLTIVYSQTMIVIILVALLVILAPFLQPVYHYYARDPDGNLITLDPLTRPNMTNRAVLSWAVTSVTEIMTIGFGDLIPQLTKQKPRFTTSGWVSFVTAFSKQRINESFKSSQLVLTTVPSDTAVILNEGPDPDGIYQWKVQVPIIMTFATNNNVTQHQHQIVTLTIERVNEDQNPAGIAIKTWLVQG
jgi:macrophage killing protein with similarity to conjugation protein